MIKLKKYFLELKYFLNDCSYILNWQNKGNVFWKIIILIIGKKDTYTRFCGWFPIIKDNWNNNINNNV